MANIEPFVKTMWIAYDEANKIILGSLAFTKKESKDNLINLSYGKNRIKLFTFCMCVTDITPIQ